MSVESSKLLLEAGADPDERFPMLGTEWTLLTFAAYNHNLDMVKLLISAGADVDLTIGKEKLPAIITALIGHRMRFNTPGKNIVEELLNAGIVTVQDQPETTTKTN